MLKFGAEIPPLSVSDSYLLFVLPSRSQIHLTLVLKLNKLASQTCKKQRILTFHLI